MSALARRRPGPATIDNAYRVAVRMAEDTGLDHVVTRTGDPTRPFLVKTSSAAEPDDDVVIQLSTG